MDLGKLGKRLRNELVRNPKKSAILGIICLVALYFWAPLVRGWLPGGKAKKPPKGADLVQAAPAQVASAAASPDPPKSARTEAVYRWDKLEEQRRSDPFASPRKLEGRVRNPFELSEALRTALAAAESEPAAEPVPAENPVVELTPRGLGLVLKGTIVGPRLRLAQINARTVREGESFDAAEPGAAQEAPQNESPNIEFTLASVHKDYIVLTRGDKSYTLEFPKRKLPPGEGLVQAKTEVEAP